LIYKCIFAATGSLCPSEISNFLMEMTSRAFQNATATTCIVVG